MRLHNVSVGIETAGSCGTVCAPKSTFWHCGHPGNRPLTSEMENTHTAFLLNTETPPVLCNYDKSAPLKTLWDDINVQPNKEQYSKKIAIQNVLLVVFVCLQVLPVANFTTK